MDQGAVIRRIRELVGQVTGIKAAYSEADADQHRIPAGIMQWPVAIVTRGPTLSYTLISGQHRHAYEVLVDVITGGADPGARVAEVSPMSDRILEKVMANVTLGARANLCLFRRSGGLQGFPEWGEGLTGYQFVFEIQEQGSATPATGV